MPYLEVEKDGEVEEDKVKMVEVPNVEGLSIKDAEKCLKESELEMSLDDKAEIDKENTIIRSQTPNAKVMVNSGSKVYLEY